MPLPDGLLAWCIELLEIMIESSLLPLLFPGAWPPGSGGLLAGHYGFRTVGIRCSEKVLQVGPPDSRGGHRFSSENPLLAAHLGPPIKRMTVGAIHEYLRESVHRAAMIGVNSDLVKAAWRWIIHAHLARVWTFTPILSIFLGNRATRRPLVHFCQSRPK